MNDFRHYLDKVDEVGEVTQVIGPIAKVTGLPKIKSEEVVMFEGGTLGQVFGVHADYADIILLSKDQTTIDERVARLDTKFALDTSKIKMGTTISATEALSFGSGKLIPIYKKPPGLGERARIDSPAPTGVGIVDIAVPLGKGQRELVLGDRKIGKTLFLLQALKTQAKAGTICIYACVGKRNEEIGKISEYIKKKELQDRCIVVASGVSSAQGLVFLTPYVAITLAEYFADQGKDVLVIMDDLTTHAKAYREISLSARRFPGRSSYPGDIFYVHARLLERAGNFKKGSITALPVAETTMGSISGYIQTNLMSMTDGHIYFDTEMFNQGRRPAINPLLSVTRVGLQAQKPLFKDISRVVSSFLARYEKVKEYMHFGSEVTQEVLETLSLGDKVVALFDQQFALAIGSKSLTSSQTINAILIAGLWAGFWKEVDIAEMKKGVMEFTKRYETMPKIKQRLDKLTQDTKTLSELTLKIKDANDLFMT